MMLLNMMSFSSASSSRNGQKLLISVGSSLMVFGQPVYMVWANTFNVLSSLVYSISSVCLDSIKFIRLMRMSAA